MRNAKRGVCFLLIIGVLALIALSGCTSPKKSSNTLGTGGLSSIASVFEIGETAAIALVEAKLGGAYTFEPGGMVEESGVKYYKINCTPVEGGETAGGNPAEPIVYLVKTDGTVVKERGESDVSSAVSDTKTSDATAKTSANAAATSNSATTKEPVQEDKPESNKNDSGDLATAKATSDQLAREIFEPAEQAYWKFMIGQIETDHTQKLTIDGVQYQLVIDKDFPTYEAVESELKNYFSDKITQDILSTPAYKQADGKFYALLLGRGNDIFFHSASYSIESQTDNKIIYKATAKYAKASEYGEPIQNPTPDQLDTEIYYFTREKIGGKWVFTDFELMW